MERQRVAATGGSSQVAGGNDGPINLAGTGGRAPSGWRPKIETSAATGPWEFGDREKASSATWDPDPLTAVIHSTADDYVNKDYADGMHMGRLWAGAKSEALKMPQQSISPKLRGSIRQMDEAMADLPHAITADVIGDTTHNSEQVAARMTAAMNVFDSHTDAYTYPHVPAGRANNGRLASTGRTKSGIELDSSKQRITAYLQRPQKWVEDVKEMANKNTEPKGNG